MPKNVFCTTETYLNMFYDSERVLLLAAVILKTFKLITVLNSHINSKNFHPAMHADYILHVC